jgi:hypothetical protein
MCFPNKTLLAVLLLSVVPLAAQTQLPAPAPIPALSQTLTTGIVGFAASQTVQLTVLNMSPTTTATLPGCEVQLAFYDSQGHQLKQGTTVTIAPGVATSLSLGRADVPAASAATPRVSIRGQVKTVVPSTGTTAGPAVLVSLCSLFNSLEVFDNTTGVTQVFSTDTRAVSLGDAEPLTAIQPAGR